MIHATPDANAVKLGSSMTAYVTRLFRWSLCILSACLLLSTPLYAQSFNVGISGPAGAVGPGSIQTYTLSINNPSSSTTLNNIRLNLSLAAGLELVDPAAIGCANATGVQICNTLTTLAPLQSNTRNFQLRMPAMLSSPPQQSFAIAYSANAGTQASATGGSVAAVVSVARSLSSSGSASPSPVNSSNDFTYQLNHTLSGPNLSWDGISITLNAPAQVLLGTASGSGFNCTGTTSTQTCTSTTAAMGVTNRSLNVPATAALVPVLTPVLSTVSASGAFLTAASVSIAQTIVPPPLDLALSKTLDSASPTAPGSTAQFRLGVRNLSVLGGQSATGFQVLDTLPAGLSMISAQGTDWSCSGSTAIACTYSASLAPQQQTPALIIVAQSLASISGTVINSAILTATGDSNSANNSASAGVSFNIAALRLLKTGPASGFVGETLEYQLALSNTGNAPAANVSISDNLPTALTFVSVSGADCNNANPVSCNVASLAANASVNVTVRARAEITGTIINTANASSGLLTATASASTVVAANVDVEIRKAGPSSVDPGGSLNYTLSVSNVGASPATSVRVVDSLPPEVQFVSAQGQAWTCTGRAQIECSLSSALAAGVSAAPITIVTRHLSASSSPIIRNTASVSASGDRNSSNDSDSASTTVNVIVPAAADLQLSLAPDASSFPATGQADVSFTGLLSNLGPDAAGTVRLLINGLPAGASLQEFQVAGVNCGLSGVCVIGNFAANAAAAVRLRVRLDAANTPSLSLMLNVTSETADPRPANNSVTASVTRGAPLVCCDIALSAEVPARAELGAEFTVVATLRNFATQAASGVTLGANLSGMSFVSANGASCSVNGARLSCSVGNLAAGASSAIQLVFSGSARGDATLSLEVASSTTDPNPSNNSLELRIAIDAATATTITTIVNQLPDPIVQSTAPAVAQICTGGSATLLAQCGALAAASGAGNTQEALEIVRALLPEETLSQGASLDQVTAVQFDNIDTRMTELRGGAEGFSADGLALAFGGKGFNLGMLRTLLNGQQEEKEEPSVGGSGDLISPWGGFVNGSYTSGNQSTAESGGRKNDFKVIGITGGVDYRKSANWVLGAALGYNAFDSDLADNGTLATKAITLSAYTSFYPIEKLYVDTRVSFGKTKIDSTRRIFIRNLIDATASGSTDVAQYSVAAAMGYQLNRGAWNFTPNASLRYARSNVDGFTETGAGDNGAQFASQTSDSTQVSLGVQLSRAISLSHGVLLPQFDVALTRELNAQGFELDASLLGAPNVHIRTRAEAPDHSFGNIGLGMVFATANGRQFYFSYRRLLATEGVERGTINLGGRFEF